MQKKKCVLCDQDNEVVAGAANVDGRADQYLVECPRCGRYFFDWILFLHRITEDFKDERFVISGAVRARTERGLKSPVELTDERDILRAFEKAWGRSWRGRPTRSSWRVWGTPSPCPKIL